MVVFQHSAHRVGFDRGQDARDRRVGVSPFNVGLAEEKPPLGPFDELSSSDCCL